MAANTALDMASILEFVVECRENMDQTERSVIRWEKEPDNRQALEHIFRGFHTLKGTCGFLGFEQLEGLAHQVENLLTRIRDENLAVNVMAVTVLLKVIDAARLILNQIEQDGEEGEGDYEVLVAELKLKTLQKQLESTTSIGKKVSEEPSADAVPTEQSIRVQVASLNRLRNVADEMKVLTSEMTKMLNGTDNHPLTKTLSRFSQAAQDLEEAVSEMRQQTLEKTWDILPRLARDTAVSLGKNVCLEISGEKTRIDAGFLPALKEAMTHIIRNCIDHGIETPAVRQAKGKTEEGIVYLRAFQKQDEVVIEVEDDGVGIFPEIIREKALQNNFMKEEQLAALDDYAILQLIFLPGFSTAREVTKLSGRGVGLDVVKTRLKETGATVEVLSHPGKGALFRMVLPQAKLDSGI